MVTTVYRKSSAPGILCPEFHSWLFPLLSRTEPWAWGYPGYGPFSCAEAQPLQMKNRVNTNCPAFLLAGWRRKGLWYVCENSKNSKVLCKCQAPH